ncbi:MAG: hypothetical protein JST00_45475 [Deltaproteobacteria bacterium]|nr:hypothetical protein [Deltaproteobacteria bacterium]
MTKRIGAAALLLLLASSCKEPEAPRPPPPPSTTEPPPPAPVPTPDARGATTPPPKGPAPGTRTLLANKTSDETWDRMLVAGGKLWVLTNLTRWTSGPMYVPAARLWSVPITGGELTKHLDLEGMGVLAADDASLYVAINRDLSKSAPKSGRIVRLPLGGGAPADVVTGIEPRTVAVDGDTLWIDDTRMPKDGSKSAVASGVKGAMTFAFDGDSAYFTTAKGNGPAGDTSGARVFRLPKKGGAPVVLATKLPEEATGLAVDATHVYFCAVSWSSPEKERAGIVARVAKGGGDVEILAKDQPSLRRLWIDDGSVYFLSGRGGRQASVLRVAKTGGEVSKVAADDTLEQATMDATSVYFSSAGTFDAGTKARLTPANLVRVVLR